MNLLHACQRFLRPPVRLLSRTSFQRCSLFRIKSQHSSAIDLDYSINSISTRLHWIRARERERHSPRWTSSPCSRRWLSIRPAKSELQQTLKLKNCQKSKNVSQSKYEEKSCLFRVWSLNYCEVFLNSYGISSWYKTIFVLSGNLTEESRPLSQNSDGHEMFPLDRVASPSE